MTRFALPVPKEADEQQTLFAWAALMEAKWPELRWMHAVPNGGSRNKIEAAHLKRQGVKRGVPDVCLPVPRHGFHGLYIEMKRQKNGRLSDEQKEFIAALAEQGYRVEVCAGAESAILALEGYMNT